MKNYTDIIDELMDSLNEEESKLFERNKTPYLITKAWFYLNDGPEKYRSKDPFRLPDIKWSFSNFKQIESGCKQILLGHGFRRDQPFEHLSIEGFYLLFHLFHFKPLKQRAINLGNGKMLDRIKFKHMMDGSTITYYNLVIKNETT